MTPSGATDKSLEWSSDDTSIAAVDSRGVVTAVSEGSALITAKSTSNPSYYDTCQIAVSSVLMNYSLSTGSTMNMTAAVSPSDNTAVWTSDKPGVAEVDDTGKVTANAPGLAMIKVTAVSDGAAAIIADADGVYAVCTILVSSEPDSEANSEDDDENEVIPTATPAASPTASPSSGTQDESDTGDESTEATPTPNVEKVVITIVVSELPEGTAAVKLPSGEVVELDGTDTIQFEVDGEHIKEDGTLELTALDDEGTPLGVYKTGRKQITIPDSGSVWSGI